MLLNKIQLIFYLIALVRALKDKSDHHTSKRSNIRKVAFALPHLMNLDLMQAEERLRVSMKLKIREIEDDEKMRQEKEFEEKERQIILKYLLRNVYPPVLRDFYSRF